MSEAVGLGSEDVALVGLKWEVLLREESIGVTDLATCCSLTVASPLLTSPSALGRWIGSSSEACTGKCHAQTKRTTCTDCRRHKYSSMPYERHCKAIHSF